MICTRGLEPDEIAALSAAGATQEMVFAPRLKALIVVEEPPSLQSNR
jgi:hypothetical protein